MLDDDGPDGDHSRRRARGADREHRPLFGVLATLTAGSVLAAIAFLTGTSGWEKGRRLGVRRLGGTRLVHGERDVLAATAGMIILPLGKHSGTANVPGRMPTTAVELEYGEPGVKKGQRPSRISGMGGSDAPTEFEQAAAFRASLRRFHRISEDAARRAGLTPRRHLLLLMIKGAPGGAERSTVSELCERMQLAQSTVTELVQRAEEAGLVRRAPAQDDGRIAYLTLTPEGERRLTTVHDQLRPEREALARILRELDGHSPARA